MKSVFLEFEKLRYPHTGLGQVCLHLGRELISKNNNEFDYKILLPLTSKSLLPESASFYGPHKLQRYLKFLLPTADTYHFLHQDSPYFCRKKSKNVILTIHDLNFLYEDEGKFEIKTKIKNLQKKVNLCDHVVCISDFTKSDVFNHLKITTQKVTTIYNGVAELTHLQSIRPHYISKRPYLFSLGAILPKKNFAVLVDMMEFLPDYDLIIAGPTFHPYAEKIKKLISTKKLSSQIHLPGEINDQERLYLYQNCSAFVHPSLVEGFGLPPLEAQLHGACVVSSDKTALKETLGPYPSIFSSFNPQEMAQVVKQTINNQNERKINDAKAWIKNRYDWSVAAQKYKEIYAK